jgi:hypothetical protein
MGHDDEGGVGGGVRGDGGGWTTCSVWYECCVSDVVLWM